MLARKTEKVDFLNICDDSLQCMPHTDSDQSDFKHSSDVVFLANAMEGIHAPKDSQREA